MERVDGYVQFVDRILDAKVDEMVTKLYGLPSDKC